jgi:hypothetical protein
LLVPIDETNGNIPSLLQAKGDTLLVALLVVREHQQARLNAASISFHIYHDERRDT